MRRKNVFVVDRLELGSRAEAGRPFVDVLACQPLNNSSLLQLIQFKRKKFSVRRILTEGPSRTVLKQIQEYVLRIIERNFIGIDWN